MSTAVMVQTTQGNIFFGRTFDFSYQVDPELYVFPKRNRWSNILATHSFRTKYNMMGIGQNISTIALSDGVNEMGLAAAALYFPDYAQYDPIDAERTPSPLIASIELVRFLLSQCADINEVAQILKLIQLVGIEDPLTKTVAPLHWLLADKSGKCVVLEKTAQGMNLHDNPIGVLSNSPDFLWHMTNLKNYLNVMPKQRPEIEWSSVNLEPCGQGTGTIGLPGDYTSPSRFVNAAYHKTHALFPVAEQEEINTCFHVMEGVSIPKGVVETSQGTSFYTIYTAFINLSTQQYYFKTHQNGQITTAKLPTTFNNTDLYSLGKLARPVKFDSL